VGKKKTSIEVKKLVERIPQESNSRSRTIEREGKEKIIPAREKKGKQREKKKVSSDFVPAGTEIPIPGLVL